MNHRSNPAWIATLSLMALVGCAAPADEAVEGGDESEVVAGQGVSQEEYNAEYPWMLSMGTVFGKLFNHNCGAELIAPTVVLTAAHCVTETEGGGNFVISPKGIVFGRGTVHQKEIGTAGNGRTTFKAKSIHRHPAYNSNNLDFDVAIIHLDAPQPGPFAKLASTPLSPDAELRTIGWGDTRRRKPDAFTLPRDPEQLQRTSLDVVDQGSCKEIYRSRDLSVTPRMVCTIGEAGAASGVCKGDSGGPLLVEGPDGLALAGVTSWVAGCGTKKFPSVFARVDELKGWIDLCASDPLACEIGPH